MASNPTAEDEAYNPERDGLIHGTFPTSTPLVRVASRRRLSIFVIAISISSVVLFSERAHTWYLTKSTTSVGPISEGVVLLNAADRLAENSTVMINRLLALAPKLQSRAAPALPALPQTFARANLTKMFKNHRERRKAKDNRNWEKGDCFIDTLIASEKLALAAATIESSVFDCSHSGKEVCATDVAGVYASFAALAAYLAGAVSTCPASGANADAMCASNMADIQYGLATLASALATVSTECSLKATETTKAIPPSRKPNAHAMCVINAAEAAAYVGHIVVSVRAAVKDCPEDDLKAGCSANVNDILQSFFLVIAYLSNAAALCGDTVIVGAECANRLTSIMAGFAEVASGGSGAHDNCRKSGKTHGNRFLDPDGKVRGAR